LYRKKSKGITCVGVACIFLVYLYGKFVQINTRKHDPVYKKEKVVCHNGNVFFP